MGTVVPGDTCDTICDITARASLSEDAVDNLTSSCDLDNKPKLFLQCEELRDITPACGHLSDPGALINLTPGPSRSNDDETMSAGRWISS